MKFKSLVIPKKLDVDKKTYTTSYGKFYAEPFESGYGHTIGNSLRRILLSSIEGAAVTAVKIKGAMHEFSVLPGVIEDTMSIILNLRKIRFKIHSLESETVFLKFKGAGEVKASDIELNSNVEVLNPDQTIATLEAKGNVEMELRISKGRGYLPVEKQDKKDMPLNMIAIDAIFTPVVRVNYEVENARVGHITDYDKLIMEIWTDGSVSPEDALSYSSRILKDSMNIFINSDETEGEEVAVVTEPKQDQETKQKEGKIDELLDQPVDIIELSVRSSNCLRNAKIKTIRELITKQEVELLNYKNFGKKSLDEIKDKLKEMKLDLGMDI
ncbi:DNA-directed RNA polymerase subunit alpha [bacterium]